VVRQQLALAVAGPRQEDILAARAQLAADDSTLSLIERRVADTVLVAPSQARERQPLSAPTTGAIHVSHIRTGRCVARLASCADGGCAHAHVLRDVSALYFSEERNELYVGDRNGLLHVYSQ
jgi:hypothetical protein